MIELLSDIVSDNMAMYREIAELLRRMSRDEELLAVLGKIHELDPGDKLTTQELAVLHLTGGDFLLSHRYFEKLSNADCLNSPCMEARATLAEKFNLPAHRLDDYEKLL